MKQILLTMIAAIAMISCKNNSSDTKSTDATPETTEVQAEQMPVEQPKPIVLADKDAEAFEPLSRAYGLPRETEEQIAARNEIMEKALVVASEAPLKLMEKIVETMSVLERLSVIGSRIAISDVGVGIQFAKAALNGASLNVYINTKLMKNRDVADDMNTRADELIIKGNELADNIYDTVMDAIR